MTRLLARARASSARAIATGRTDNDEGAVLVIVLLFMIAVAVLVGSLLTATTTAEEATSAQNLAHADVYAVDGGIEYGLEQLRGVNGATWCTGASSPVPVPATVNGATVTVSCNPASTEFKRISNWALVSMDPGAFNGLQTQSGASSPIEILGPTFVEGGMNLKSQLQIDRRCAGSNIPPGLTPGCTAADGNGFIFQYSTNCSSVTSPSTYALNTGSKAVPPFGTGPPNGNWACTSSLPPISVPTPTKPGLPAAPPIVTPSCTELWPGHYTAVGTAATASSMPLPNNLTGVKGAYLVSGTYYFDNVGTIDLGGTASATQLFGGQPTGAETQVTTAGSPCASDPVGWSTANGTGVELILGGTSAINANKGGFELYTRLAAGSTQLLPSLITVPAVPAPAGSGQPAAWGAPWNTGSDPTTVTGGSLILQSATGSQPNVAIHGFVYTPAGSWNLFGTNNSVGEILGGMVGWDISLQKSASASNFSIATSESPFTESNVLIAKVQYGGKVITATANVSISQTDAVTINSWTVNNP